jgi:nucleotide-binding universal stress UspA family protein
MTIGQPGRVVVGVGHSLGAYQALRYAVDEARHRELTLLAVRAYWTPPNAQILANNDLLAQAAIHHVHMAFAEALGGFPADVPVQASARLGAVGRALVLAANRDRDLLVVGGCGPRRLAHLRRTTIARFCALEATCPVVIVPPTALARSAHLDRLARDAASDAQDYLYSDGSPD